MTNTNKLLILFFLLHVGISGKAAENDSLGYRPVQLTFISPLSTNGFKAGEYVNNFSLNILYGTSGGVRGFELGGLVNHSFGNAVGVQAAGIGNNAGGFAQGVQFAGIYNIARENMKGLQAAGIGNSSGGYAHGVQFAGIYNISRESMKGLQAAGIGNAARTEMKGVQFAGLYNMANYVGRGAQFAGIVNLVNGPYHGFQMAGITNINLESSRGHQYAGLVNLSKESLHGAQVAGLVNLSSDAMHGLQAAGLVNLHSGQSRSLQIAGLMNRTKENVNGAQIAGLLNMARKVNGLQLGLVNIADTVERGVPIGLFSIVKHGYRVFEVEANESLYLNLTFKMGVPQFYTIYTLGIRPQGDLSIWAPGIGVGTFVPLSRKVGFNIDGIAYQVNEGEWWTNETNLLNKLRINTSVHLSERLRILAGVSLNVTVSKVKGTEGQLKGIAIDPPVVFYEAIHNNTQVMVYPGLNFGLQF